jgi:hypothetical protein
MGNSSIRHPLWVIGGLAVQGWGEPRFTRDVDVTIIVNSGDEEKIVKKFSLFFHHEFLWL